MAKQTTIHLADSTELTAPSEAVRWLMITVGTGINLFVVQINHAGKVTSIPTEKIIFFTEEEAQ